MMLLTIIFYHVIIVTNTKYFSLSIARNYWGGRSDAVLSFSLCFRRTKS